MTACLFYILWHYCLLFCAFSFFAVAKVRPWLAHQAFRLYSALRLKNLLYPFFQESQGAVSPTREQARKEAERKMQRYTNKQKLVGTTMEAIQATTEPIDEQDHLP